MRPRVAYIGPAEEVSWCGWKNHHVLGNASCGVDECPGYVRGVCSFTELEDDIIQICINADHFDVLQPDKVIVDEMSPMMDEDLKFIIRATRRNIDPGQQRELV